MMENWFCIVNDNDGHRYIIPSKHLEEWYDFMELDPEDERSWDVPEWAERIDGGRLYFKAYKIV